MKEGPKRPQATVQGTSLSARNAQHATLQSPHFRQYAVSQLDIPLHGLLHFLEEKELLQSASLPCHVQCNLLGKYLV